MAKTQKNVQNTKPTSDNNKDRKTKKVKEPRDVHELMGFMRAVPIILVASALFITLCFITGQTGAFGNFISGLFKGLFSYMAYTIPAFILIHAITFSSDFKKRRVLSRVVISFVSLVMLSMIAFIIANIADPEAIVFNAAEFYKSGIENVGGGFVGSVLAYALTKLFGYVGLLIIIAVVFIIFAIFAFYGGGKEITLFTLKKLAAAFNFGARMEAKAKNKKARKATEKEARKRAAAEKKNAKFYEDDFFYTDNGVSELEIPELGIVETNDNAGYVLRETVVHEEPSNDSSESKNANDTTEDVKHKVSTGYEEIITDDSGADEDAKKYREDDIVIEIPADSIEAKPTESDSKDKPKVTLADLGISDNADDIFTAGFDPYDLALNQKYAAKQSSRAAELTKDEPKGYSEYISNLTPEEAERLERLRRFEECKAAAAKRKEEAEDLAKQKEEDARAEANADADTVETDTVPVRTAENEQRTQQTPCEEVVQPVSPDTSEEEFTMTYGTETADDEEAEEAEVVKPIVTVNQINDDYNIAYGGAREPKHYDSYRFVAGMASASEDKPVVNNKPHTTAYGSVARTLALDEETPKQAPVYTPVAEEPKQTYAYTPVAEEPKQAPTYAPAVEEPKQAPAYAPVSVPKEETTLYFSVADEEDDENDKDIGENTIEITREQIGSFGEEEEIKYGLDFSEEDDEAEDDEVEDFGEEDAEIPEAPVEIPKEEQNPVISDYRGMFDIFKHDDESDDEQELSEEDDESTVNDEEIEPEETVDEDIDEDEECDESVEESEIAEEDNEDEVSPEIEEEEIEEEEIEDDEPPFDEPKDAVKPAPKEEKKRIAPDYSNYKFPPIDLLKKGQTEDYSKITDELQESSEKLIGALEAFNIAATVRSMERGPRITRYSIVPAKGVRVNQIERLSDDIALAMAAESIRIEAPIPGKSAVGVEVPNKIPSLVSLRDLLESDEFINDKSKTAVCIGKSVEGSLVFGDIAKMPHLLVAGATGMGKSVCMNSLITSILYKARPDEVKFIMIDPKKVEFAPYNGIPHLLVPVVTDPKQAAGTLMWAVDEMNKRYDIIEKLCVRGIDSYNEKVAENPELGAPMPKIVIFIDELNDLMIQVRDPVENLIMLIAQKARAAGIHLVIGTQRPSVNVITGVIKANIPSRIACKVSSSIDSRTILEQTGAEKLIGKGDMLFSPGGNAPKRVQGAYVSENETATIVDFVKNQVKGGVMYDEQAMEDMKRAAQKCDKNKNDGGDFDDEEESDVGYLHDRKFLDAVELAIRNGSVATSFLQRKMRIGYGKAAQYIDIMEDLGVVGEKNGSKPRDILISMAEWQEKLSRLTLDD